MAGLSLEMVYSTLKACVISNPDGVDEDCLNSEFRLLMGSGVPWKDLGFKSLHDLVVSSPNLRVVNRGGRRLVVAETDSVKHLSSMIKTQKKPSSSRKRHPRLNDFFQKKIRAYKPPPRSFGGSYSSSGFPPSGRKPSLKRVEFVEHNNNFPVRPSSNKTINHNTNHRPAGDSSSSGNSSPTLAPTPESKPIIKQSQKEPAKKEEIKLNKEEIKSNKEEIKSKKEEIKSKKVPAKPKSLSLQPADKSNKEKKKKSSSSPKSPLLPTPVPGSVSPLIPVNLSQFSITDIGPPSQHLLSMSRPDLIPTEPIVYLSPINLQSAFIPANLVPPKPMKPGSYRGGRRKLSMRSKLKSIQDNSTPSEDSMTAQFINLIKAQEWPEPEYRLLPRLGANKQEVYGCTVRGSYSLDNETLLTYDYSTIPDEFPNMNSSKEAVSRKAYEDLSNKIKEASNYVPATSNPDTVIQRVSRIVSDFPNGLWAYKVESDYKAKFNERLPSGWVQLIADSNCLAAEKLADFSHVIRPAVKTKNEIDGSTMAFGELEYPPTETWDIFVTKIVSSSEVWFRFVGPSYSDWLDEVTKEMCHYYEDWSACVCTSPEVGHTYVYPSLYGAVRVKVLSLDNPDFAKVMHIDHGDVEEIRRDHLCFLDPSFRNLPPQAVCCKMYDLEDYSDNKLCTAFLMDKIEGMVLVAEIIQTEPLVLIMFDTSFDEPINLNQDVVNQLRTDITSPPFLSQDLIIPDGQITSIWRTGEIYLQLPSSGLDYLTLQLNSLQEIPIENFLTHPEELVPDMLYLVQVDGQWLRASILPPARPINNLVDLLLIDTGDIKSCLFTDLVPLSLISMVLCEIPRQALRLRLSNVNIFEETVEKLQSLMSPPCKAIIKVISVGQVPEVEMFIREAKGLISVNETLCFEDKLSKKINSVTLNTSSTDFYTIKQALTPECGEFFEVFVVSVSNPSNFVVIPRKYIKELTNLQSRLQDHYNSVNHFAFRLRNFTIGQACAVQHTDSQWYRGLIEQVIDRSMSQFMIRFCDFGNLAMISADRLLTLDQTFLNLPALGFSASIADIQPISGDWEFVDCLRSQKLMLEKFLVTVIKAKNLDKGGQTTLKLQVFDTTGETDCDIGSILVDELRASYV